MTLLKSASHENNSFSLLEKKLQPFTTRAFPEGSDPMPYPASLPAEGGNQLDGETVTTRACKAPPNLVLGYQGRSPLEGPVVTEKPKAPRVTLLQNHK